MDGKVAFDLLSRAHRSCEMESPHESEAWQALKSAVEIANSIQQLKAEILLLIQRTKRCAYADDMGSVKWLLEQIDAKLSAV